jgi:hypothetical protein
MRYGKAPPSPWYFTLPQGYPGQGIYATPHPSFPSQTVHLGATPNPGFALALAVGAGILMASLFTVMVKH